MRNRRRKRDEEINQRGKGGDIDENFLSFLLDFWELAVDIHSIGNMPQSN